MGIAHLGTSYPPQVIPIDGAEGPITAPPQPLFQHHQHTQRYNDCLQKPLQYRPCQFGRSRRRQTCRPRPAPGTGRRAHRVSTPRGDSAMTRIRQRSERMALRNTSACMGGAWEAPYLGNGCGQGGLAVVDMPDSANVQVGLCAGVDVVAEVPDK